MRSTRIPIFPVLIIIATLAAFFFHAQNATAHQVTKHNCVYYAVHTTGGPDIRQYHECQRWALRHNNTHGLVVPPLLSAIRACESGRRSHGRGVLGTFKYTAQNPTTTASGAYQYLDTTWNKFHGYTKARLAPRRIQDTRALADFHRSTTPWQFGDWQHCWGTYR